MSKFGLTVGDLWDIEECLDKLQQMEDGGALSEPRNREENTTPKVSPSVNRNVSLHWK